MANISPAMRSLVVAIENAHQMAKSQGLARTAQLLEIARIDALARAHNISDEELDLFFFALESNVRVEQHVTLPDKVAPKRRMARG